MISNQYSDHFRYSLDNSSQIFNDDSPNCISVSQIDAPRYFDDSGYLHNAMQQNMSLVDPTSLPPSGLSYSNPSLQRISMRRKNPPALHILNNIESSANASDSAYSGHDQSSRCPSINLQTPATPVDQAFYMNGSGADSMTSFSPSSTTSGELDSAEGVSPRTVDTPLADADGKEAFPDVIRSGGERVERKKRNSRRMWTHSLEKYIFTPHEIATLGTPHRRTIYSASLEAHIDRLHSQLLGVGLYPVHFDDLEVYRGLNCKIAKGMVAGLQHDHIQVRTRHLEIERATNNAREMAAVRANHGIIGAQSDGRGIVDQVDQTHEDSMDASTGSDTALSLVHP